MKSLLTILFCLGLPVIGADKKPASSGQSAIIEKEIRRVLKKLTGELTKADLEKVKGLSLSTHQLTDVKGLEKLTELTSLNLSGNQLTNVTGLEKLTRLKKLWLEGNPDLTKAQIAELQTAAPKCKIYSNPKK